MRAVLARLAPEVAERVIFDLGLSRPLGYYTGAIFEVYDAALGAPLGGGGRYDDLLGRFGRDLPAVGWALNVERLHLALVGEERRRDGAGVSGPERPARSRCRAARCSRETLDAARRARRRHRRGARQRPQAAVRRRRPRSPCGPSDVPTYVEAGAADLGITGKDVLAEQSERAVYELVDLRYGPCAMVFATVAGEDPAAEALRRLGVMRVATKYPRIAGRWFERTGRQAEIVEVKGSVELAPLTGLVEGIVDLTATGTTLRENGLVVREEIMASSARLIANPVAHKLQGRRDGRAAGPRACGVRAG